MTAAVTFFFKLNTKQSGISFTVSFSLVYFKTSFIKTGATLTLVFLNHHFEIFVIISFSFDIWAKSDLWLPYTLCKIFGYKIDITQITLFCNF